MELAYREHRPSPPLARHVRCLWSLRGGGLPSQTIVPDGCAELVIDFGDPVVRLVSGEGHRAPRLSLVGEVRRPVTLAPCARVDLLGVRLRPGALGVLFDEPPERLVDASFDLDALLGIEDRRALGVLWSEEAPAARLRHVERWLLGRLRRAAVDDRLVRRAVELIDAAGGATPVERLAAELRVQRRRLERTFKAIVGTSPKSLSRVRRFRRALGAIEVGRRFVEVAATCGYFDQAHLIGDFRRYTGRSPGAYLRSVHELDRLFEGTERV